jgi:hypothetical protein
MVGLAMVDGGQQALARGQCVVCHGIIRAAVMERPVRLL